MDAPKDAVDQDDRPNLVNLCPDPEWEERERRQSREDRLREALRLACCEAGAYEAFLSGDDEQASSS